MRLDRPDFSEDVLNEFSPIDLSHFYERCWKDLLDLLLFFRFDHKIDILHQNKKEEKW